MKRSLVFISVAAFLLCGTARARADTILNDWFINLGGTIVDAGSLPAPGVNTSGFDFVTGLGTLSVTVGPGTSSVLAFVDHEIDELANGFFNEIGSTSGSPVAGQSWEIDEPGWAGGDIVANALVGTLDGLNGVPITWPEDVAMGLGWDFVLAADETAIISFVVSTVAPASGFYLHQLDPDSQNSVYFSSSLAIRGGSIPEPAMLLLMGLGLVMGAARLRRR